MPKEITLSSAKANLPKIVKGVQKREEEVILTRNGRPAAVLMNYDEFQRLQATLDVLNDRPLMKQIRSSQSYYLRKKKGQSFEEVFEEPL